MRALVIDDDPTIREMVSLLLRLEGFDVAVAEDGAAGLERARQSPPDVVVLDVMMPKLDGWSVARQLRNLPGLSNVPFVFCTALGDQDSTWQGWLAGAASYVTKPFDNAVLVGEVLRAAHGVAALSSGDDPSR